MCIPAALGVWVAISSIGVLFFPPAAFSFAPPPFWGCPPCNRSACPPVACDESLQYVDGCGCCAMCAKVEGERCGGEREVGGRCNSSGLYCAYRLGSIFGESRVGICENERCQRKWCEYRQRCVVVFRDNGGVRKKCQCDYIRCDNKSNPLCGRDGRSYTSVCELQRAECLAGAPIGIQHFDACQLTYTVQRKLYSNLPREPPPTQCLYGDEFYDPHHIRPPTSTSPCTYHVCSDCGHFEQYPVLGCEGNPPEQDWRVDEVVHPAEWSEWSEFSSCEGDCERAGRENQTRTCTNPPPSTNPEAEASVLRCEGRDLRDRLCEPSHCQICHYTTWSPWSECSTSTLCSGGLRTRHRNITNSPTVPELCSTDETKECQLLKCDNCSRYRSDQFHIYNPETQCRSNWPRTALLCAGSCGNGKCCRGVFFREPEPRRPDITFEFECPHNPGRPFIEQYRPPRYCECRDCNADYDELEFMKPPWKVIY